MLKPHLSPPQSSLTTTLLSSLMIYIIPASLLPSAQQQHIFLSCCACNGSLGCCAGPLLLHHLREMMQNSFRYARARVYYNGIFGKRFFRCLNDFDLESKINFKTRTLTIDTFVEFLNKIQGLIFNHEIL